MVLVSFLSTMGSIALCWRLARSVGMDWKRAFLSTAAYSLSINTLYYSTVGLSYAVEGFFATAVGFLAFRTLRKRTWRDAVALTAAWGLGGAIRPTTTVFLAPLWLYCCLHVRPRWRVLGVNGILAAALIAPWVYGNHHFLMKHGGGQSFEFQAGLAGNYDPATLLKIVPGPYANVKGMGYHWPFIEVAVYVDDRLGTHLFPRRERWADPSLRHALRIAAYQILKVGFYAGVSAPVLLPFLFMLFTRIPVSRRSSATPARPDEPLRRGGDWTKPVFYILWFTPALLFFVVGHMGSFGYLQVFLSGLIVACYEYTWTRPNGNGYSLRLATVSKVLAIVLPLGGGAFFLLGRPLQSQSNAATLATVALFQYTGPAILMRYNVSRADLIVERMQGGKPWWRTELPHRTFDE